MSERSNGVSERSKGVEPRRLELGRIGAAAAVVLLLPLGNAALRAAELPGGFEQSVYVERLFDPNAIEFAPDGRLFVSERITGRLRVVRDGRLLPAPFARFSVPPEHPSRRTEAARAGFVYPGIYFYGAYRSAGLHGLAFDPDFENNGYLYVYYMNDRPRVNRVSRVRASRSDPDRAEVDSEQVLLDIPMHALDTDGPIPDGGSHSGGALCFGPDGMLYVGVGDGWEPAPPDAPQDVSNLIGKVLRIRPDGTVPDDNPFVDVPGARPEIWALGFRNPYTMAVHPRTRTIYVNDVVWGKETIYELARGGNYQHPSFQGPGERQEPVHAGAGLIAGGQWYDGDRFPVEFRGSYFFSDWRAGVIRRLRSDVDRRVDEFARGLTRPTYLRQGPDGALYWLSANYETLNGVVYRIDYQGPTEPAREQPAPPPDESLLDGLVGHWPLDDGEGELARDISGRGPHARLVGQVQWAPDSSNARFDGRTVHGVLGAVEVGGEQLTIAAWIRAESFLEPMADGRIVSKAVGDQEPDHVWMLSTVRDGPVRLRARLQAGGQTRTLVAERGGIELGRWTHVAATYDGSRLRLFQDGQPVGSLTHRGPIDRAPAVPAWIGDNPPHAGSRPWHGAVRDLRLYERALDADALEALAVTTDPRGAAGRAERREALASYRAALERPGRAERGRAVYVERCANCHRLRGQGVAVGPDLDQAATESDDFLLEAILDPNRRIAPQFWNYLVVTRDGRVLQGLIVQETPTALALRTLNAQDQWIQRDEIERFRRLDESLMPERLEAELTVDDLADLLAFLRQDP